MRGDAESALALGLAYALDTDDVPIDVADYFLPYGALDNDAAQSYRWLARYLQLAPEGSQAPLARHALAQLAARLDPGDRAAIDRELQFRPGRGTECIPGRSRLRWCGLA